MKLVCISDTHLHLGTIAIPEGDILIHCGDLTNRGSVRETAGQAAILCGLKDRFRHVIFVPGNHDWLFYMENNGIARGMVADITYLEDRLIEVDGLRIYGSPWTPMFMDWAFMLKRGPDIRRKWEMIPSNLDVLITHGPPKGILDKNVMGEEVGCADLKEVLESLPRPPRLHAFGHIHESYGRKQGPGMETIYVNAAICNERYQPTNAPIVVEL